MMTKKDYKKFAEMLIQAYYRYFKKYGQDYLYAISDIRDDMIKLFKQDNPLFDEDKFNQYIAKHMIEFSHQ